MMSYACMTKRLTCTKIIHIFLRSIDHSQALKHDVDIPGNLGAGQAVGDSRQLKYRLAVLSCSL